MQKKIICTTFIFIIIINLVISVYADDELEETSISQSEIEEILETTVDASKIPTINSRNAVCYDRTTRKSFIWKAGK